ncbi:hypothetical protein N7460_006607 [Penicillium canescens]|uniref:Uncharacterized protein n=1 Tax=Penicillium canescens TaxID=5083 RepID=A0AAD6NAQ5_PENCN|nr:hypothetical protein N7460_006607 [Penicillium canescens]KAJ6056721.1 hypothetical protein N7444_005819 [Penicillium canescens]
MVQLLLSIGTSVNAEGGRYGNALQAASYQGHEEIVRVLIKEGANVNAQGGCYGSALQAAKAGRHKAEEQRLNGFYRDSSLQAAETV